MKPPARQELRYYTPQLYRRMQTDNFRPADFESAVRAYNKSVATGLRCAPVSVKLLATTWAFHDLIIAKIAIEAPQRLTLLLHGRGKLLTRNLAHTVTFNGVTDGQFDMTMPGQHWCYHEIHRTDGLFDLRVLLADSLSTFAVRFKNVTLIQSRLSRKTNY